MSQTIKGIIIRNTVKLVEDKKGIEGIAWLKEKMQDSLDISLIKSYPIDFELNLQKYVCQLLFNGNKDGYIEIGRYNFRYFSESLIGKTTFALLKGEIGRATSAVAVGLNSISTGFEVEAGNVSSNKARIFFKNSPYPKEYFQGVWIEALEFLHTKGTVTVHDYGQGKQEYIVEW